MQGLRKLCVSMTTRHDYTVCLFGRHFHSFFLQKEERWKGEREPSRQRRGKNLEGRAYNIREEAKNYQIGSQHTTQPKEEYTHVFTIRKTLGLFSVMTIFVFFLYFLFFFFFALKFLAPWLFSTCFICMKVLPGISISQYSDFLPFLFTFNIQK